MSASPSESFAKEGNAGRTCGGREGRGDGVDGIGCGYVGLCRGRHVGRRDWCLGILNNRLLSDSSDGMEARQGRRSLSGAVVLREPTYEQPGV